MRLSEEYGSEDAPIRSPVLAEQIQDEDEPQCPGVFTAEDFGYWKKRFKTSCCLKPKICDELEKACVGKPLFSPYPYFEEEKLPWADHVGLTIMTSPELADGIIKGTIPLSGQFLTDVGDRLPFKEQGKYAHALRLEVARIASYKSPWLSLLDFSPALPEWALISAETYDEVLDFVNYPIYLGDRRQELVTEGFQSLKHEIVYSYLQLFINW